MIFYNYSEDCYQFLYEICLYNDNDMGKILKRLKILFVGINDYPEPVSKLRGCVNDIKNIRNTIHNLFGNSFQIVEKILLNNEATREQIIYQFKQHFSDLVQGDVALFYFSGHGSRNKAPKEFCHNTPDGMMESLVCYDSRTDSGCDIADKELSVLIWEVTKESNVPFTVILDSCHSGGSIRKERVKGEDTDKRIRSWKEFYGAESFHYSNDQAKSPIGRYILLSACRDTEFAKEKYLDGIWQGVFTYSLLNVLHSYGSNLSYSDLINHIQITVQNETFEQYPQLKALFLEDKRRLFLDHEKSNSKPKYILYYNENHKNGLATGWILNIGSIGGITKNNNESKNNLHILENEKSNPYTNNVIAEVSIIKVFPTFCTVDIPVELDKNKQFSIQFQEHIIPPIDVKLEQLIDEGAYEILKPDLEANPFVQLVDSEALAQYAIGIKNGQYSISSLDKSGIWFVGFAGINRIASELLYDDLQKIAQWHYFKELQNGISSLNDNILGVDFMHVTEPSGNFLEVVEEAKVSEILDTPPLLTYTANNSLIVNEKLEGAVFRLKLSNLSKDGMSIWVSVLYFGSDYSITNALLPIQLLNAEEYKWLEYQKSIQHKPAKLIPVHIADSFIQRGITETTEYFKIIVGTGEFDTSGFAQDGLSISNGGNRAIGAKNSIRDFKPSDWYAIDFSVRIQEEVEND